MSRDGTLKDNQRLIQLLRERYGDELDDFLSDNEFCATIGRTDPNASVRHTGLQIPECELPEDKTGEIHRQPLSDSEVEAALNRRIAAEQAAIEAKQKEHRKQAAMRDIERFEQAEKERINQATRILNANEQARRQRADKIEKEAEKLYREMLAEQQAINREKAQQSAELTELEQLEARAAELRAAVANHKPLPEAGNLPVLEDRNGVISEKDGYWNGGKVINLDDH